SQVLSHQLQSLASQLIATNSESTQAGTTQSPLLDKITTVHQLNDDIDQFLMGEFAENCYLLEKLKVRLEQYVDKCKGKLNSHGGRQEASKVDPKGSAQNSNRENNHHNNRSKRKHTNHIDTLQRRCELIDQDLRILEQTLKNIQ
ncbi:hypothetical protein PP707_04205, partial [Acetobacter pasteurianus]|nr:hypothetical protein [Acetobacter pasteurianus]